jgi:hypothetical protein
MAAQSCPVCGNPAAFKRVAHGGWRVDCIPCGSYEITASAWPLMQGASAGERHVALSWAKACNQRHPGLLVRPCVTSVCFGETGDAPRHGT